MLSDRRQCACGLAAAMVGLSMVRAAIAAPIPEDRRIEARLLRTITAPASDPMHMPTDVAVDRADRVYVADGANDRVLRFTPAGEVDETITDPGGSRLVRPVGVSVDDAGGLWIADSGNHRIVSRAAGAASWTMMNLPEAPGGRPFEPTDIAVSPAGKRIFIVDNENHRLAIRDTGADGFTFLGRFGEPLGQFRWPFMIALADDGYVFITEAIGARVQRLSPQDRWAGQVGRWGVKLGDLYRPKGIAIDGGGRLYVSDSTTRVVQVFNERGSLIGVLCGGDGAPMRLAHPMGMTFDRAGHLYVVELGADRVAVLEVNGAVPPGVKDANTTRPANEQGTTESRPAQ